MATGRRYAELAVLALLVIAGVVTALGESDPGVSLSAALEAWSDVLRDADQFGLRLTRVSDREEMDAGLELAGSITRGSRGNPEWAAYVAAVGQSLLPNIHRTGISYEFHVIESRGINAFALPGGQIFVLTGMLDFLRSEAELAAILGHEISHVDLRHCIERYQYEVALKRVGLGGVGQISELARNLVAAGFSKYQELEADAQGVRLSIQAGYEPGAGAAVFDRLRRREHPRISPPPETPAAELARIFDEAMGSYFRSHPPSDERTRRLEALVGRSRARLSGRTFYVGRENYTQRIPRGERDLPSEHRSL